MHGGRLAQALLERAFPGKDISPEVTPPLLSGGGAPMRDNMVTHPEHQCTPSARKCMATGSRKHFSSARFPKRETSPEVNPWRFSTALMHGNIFHSLPITMHTIRATLHSGRHAQACGPAARHAQAGAPAHDRFCMRSKGITRKTSR